MNGFCPFVSRNHGEDIKINMDVKTNLNLNSFHINLSPYGAD